MDEAPGLAATQSQVIQPLPAGCLHRRHHPNAHAGLGSAKGEEMSHDSEFRADKSDFSSPSAQVSLAPVLMSSPAFTSLHQPHSSIGSFLYWGAPKRTWHAEEGGKELLHQPISALLLTQAGTHSPPLLRGP